MYGRLIIRYIRTVVLFAAASLCCAFGDSGHFITDPTERETVETDFRQRMDHMKSVRSYDLVRFVGKEDITPAEREALLFLLAYSPLCDIADCEPEYFLDQVRGAFRAREYFPWGDAVSEGIFRHFVLPPRVNNENLDEAREVFFHELKDRIKGLSMYDAALEVNHWCHEKVEYRATDSRTSAPLALVRTSWGRCGEESAFTAAAMRAVGIPARQVYTPRWVHTDSNHAWVEVWIDGRWHYLGACEPEPELDMAWFTGPATRAMIMHTTVFGKYEGPEEVTVRGEHYNTINLLGNYAPTRRVTVTVVDNAGNRAEGAEVKFKVYNYAEFFAVTTRTTGEDGTTSLTTGYGDILIWANKGDRYGYFKIGTESDNAVVILDRKAGREDREDFVMNVPAAQPLPAASQDKVAENRRRLAQEDSIRNAYMATFIYENDYSIMIPECTGIEYSKVMDLLREAQGNYDEIALFMGRHKDNPYLLPFLESLSAKDLRDTPAVFLDDHIDMLTLPAYEVPDELIASKILSPRIDMERIAPWRSALREDIFYSYRSGLNGSGDFKDEPYGRTYRSGISDPLEIVRYVRENIRVDDAQNYVACSITPTGVHRIGMADRRSRNVFFVALCRTAGIPAHIDRATGKPQFWKDSLWHDALLDGEDGITAVPEMGKITFHSRDDNPFEPVYRTHYTIAKYENGDFRTLDLSGELSRKPYPATVEVPAGYYRLIAGSRANDGSVAVNTRYFNLENDRHWQIPLKLPELTGKLLVEGILDMNTVIFLPDGTKTTLKEQSRDKGLILVFVDPATEPTRHVLQEMPAFTENLEDWGGGVLFVEQEHLAGATFNRSVFGDLPSQTVWMTDSGRSLLDAAAQSLRTDFTNEFPLTLYLNTSGGILFSHKGYRVGLAGSLVNTIKAELEMLEQAEP